MTLAEFIAVNGFKYLVIGLVDWQTDELAQTLAPAPRQFALNGSEYVLISLEPNLISEIADSIVLKGEYEFGFNRGNGKASFLTYDQALTVVSQSDETEVE